VKIRDGVVTNRVVYLAIGIDCDGNKQVLGLWVGPTTGESAKFWLSVLSDLKARGVADVCIVCCDGLTGLPDAISAVWPQAIVQLCVVHLIRAWLRYASKKYWVPLSRDLRPVYTAADETAAAAALEDFAVTWGERYPAIVKVWRAHWAEFTPFLAFPPEVRRVIYTTNLIESMNSRLRKVTRNRGQFPSEQARSKFSTWPCGTCRTTAAGTSASAAPGGMKRCKRSRSISKDEAQPHDRHDHLHRRSDAPWSGSK
jgi:transposase-like protein